MWETVSGIGYHGFILHSANSANPTHSAHSAGSSSFSWPLWRQCGRPLPQAARPRVLTPRATFSPQARTARPCSPIRVWRFRTMSSATVSGAPGLPVSHDFFALSLDAFCCVARRLAFRPTSSAAANADGSTDRSPRPQQHLLLPICDGLVLLWRHWRGGLFQRRDQYPLLSDRVRHWHPRPGIGYDQPRHRHRHGARSVAFFVASLANIKKNVREVLRCAWRLMPRCSAFSCAVLAPEQHGRRVQQHLEPRPSRHRGVGAPGHRGACAHNR